ncbi:MAG: uncharacterized SAM-binding protein YcdF (DUF218 family) [Alphaproteobacteria bacterium]|jgi:uncharacterized SAM-binding protein YcdF (DUF218 family)
MPRWGLVALTAAILWIAGLIWFAEAIPAAVDDADTQTDAVVVLTGAAGRLGTGIDLLAGKKAKKLFVSGVYHGVDVQQLLRLARRPGAALDCCMVLGHAADDTRGNAEETAQWVTREGFTSLRLVTSSYHMRRSLLEFRRAMPSVRIIAHPVFPKGFKARGWWNWPGTFQLIVTEYSKYLVALARPW